MRHRTARAADACESITRMLSAVPHPTTTTPRCPHRPALPSESIVNAISLESYRRHITRLMCPQPYDSKLGNRRPVGSNVHRCTAPSTSGATWPRLPREAPPGTGRDGAPRIVAYRQQWSWTEIRRCRNTRIRPSNTLSTCVASSDAHRLRRRTTGTTAPTPARHVYPSPSSTRPRAHTSLPVDPRPWAVVSQAYRMLLVCSEIAARADEL